MIAYLRCNCGRNKLRAKQLADEGWTVRFVNMSSAWREEAKRYNTRLPFGVKDGVIVRL